ncbi:hypothetical protein HK102_007718, partial [Quaeritorhiza haematococci]
VADLLPAAAAIESASTSVSSSPSKSNAKPSSSRPDDSGDGLVIVARGLGLRNVLLAFLQIYADSRNLVLLINTPSREIQLLRDDLISASAFHGPDLLNDGSGQKISPQSLKVINNETPATERYD